MVVIWNGKGIGMRWVAVFLLCLGLLPGGASGKLPMTIVLNDSILPSDTKAFMQNGTVYLPVRGVYEAVSKENRGIIPVHEQGRVHILFWGYEQQAERDYVLPLQELESLLNVKGVWDASSRTVWISTGSGEDEVH